MNTKKTTPRYIMAKLLTDREGNNETTDSRLSTENIPLSATGRWNAIFKVMKGNKRQPAILHREKSFKKKKRLNEYAFSRLSTKDRELIKRNAKGSSGKVERHKE